MCITSHFSMVDPHSPEPDDFLLDHAQLEQGSTPNRALPVDSVREQVADVLQPHDAIPELTPAEQAQLIDFGDRLIEGPDPMRGLAAYEAAGLEVPKEKLIALGDRLCSENNNMTRQLVALETAFEAYKRANDWSKLIALGDRFLEKGEMGSALEAYNFGRATEKLIALGDSSLPRFPDFALMAYAAAGAKEKMRALLEKDS